MTIATAVRSNLDDLPDALKVAQDAIELPDVREMLQRLSAYNLGIFMPHMHDEQGGFQPLPNGVMQVEDAMKVSFRPVAEAEATQIIPIGWVWTGEHSTTAIGCRQVCVTRPGDTQHYHDHKVP